MALGKDWVSRLSVSPFKRMHDDMVRTVANNILLFSKVLKILKEVRSARPGASGCRCDPLSTRL